MTSFGALTNALTRRKIQVINHLLVLDIIAILLTILYAVYQGDLSAADPLIYTMSYSLVVFFVAFILIARHNERIFVNDSYRLVPTSDTGLYSANLLSAFISMIYLGVTQIIFSMIAAAMNFQQVMTTLGQAFEHSSPTPGSMNSRSEIIGALIGLVILMIVSTIFAWASISLIHLTTSALTAFLPDSRSRLYRFILYVVVIAAILYILGKIVNPIGDIFYGMVNDNSYYQIYLSSLALLVVAVLESAVNVYLLRNWVETTNW
ncbi:MAG: ABC transporter permease [Lentilactobacillus hilgardii]